MIVDGTFNPHQDHNNCCSLWNPSVVIVCSNGFVWNLIIWNIKGKSFEFLRHTIFLCFFVCVLVLFFYYFIYSVLNVNARTQVLWFVRYNGNFFHVIAEDIPEYFESLWNFFHTKRWIEISLCNGKFQSIFTIRMQLSFILGCLLVVAVYLYYKT